MEFDILENAARDLYALGDHLHPWDEAGPAVKMAYRLQIGLVMTVLMPPPGSGCWGVTNWLSCSSSMPSSGYNHRPCIRTRPDGL